MPTLELTDAYIRNLMPTATRTEHTDTKVQGLTLRVTPDGVKSWALRYRPKPGAPQQRLTLGTYPDLLLKKARKKATSARGQVADGSDPAAEKKAAREAAKVGPTLGDTWADLAADYLKHWAIGPGGPLKPRKRSWQDDERYINVEILPHWKTKKVRETTRRDVIALLDAIVDRDSPVTANRVRKLLSVMIKKVGIPREYVEHNIIADVPVPHQETSRARELTNDELRALWDACATERPIMCTLLRLRMVTMQRGGELAKLKEADWDGEWFTIPEHVSKNKKAHRVPASPLAKRLMLQLPRFAGTEYLFPGRPITKATSDIKKAGRRVVAVVLKELQKTNPDAVFDCHLGQDSRRTASTKIAEAGISDADIAKVLGHTESGSKDEGPRVTKVYNRYRYDDEKCVALNTWARLLQHILKAKPTKKQTTVVPFARKTASRKIS